MGKDLKGTELGREIHQRKDRRYEVRIYRNGAVLLTALYNSVNTINSYYGNRYHFHLAEETRREMEETD